MLKSKE